MLGAIFGDIAGSIYEFDNIKTAEFDLLGEGTSFTDDSILTVAVGWGAMVIGSAIGRSATTRNLIIVGVTARQ